MFVFLFVFAIVFLFVIVYTFLFLLHQHSVNRGLGRKQLFSVKQASGALKLKLDPLYVCILICICNCISICKHQQGINIGLGRKKKLFSKLTGLEGAQCTWYKTENRIYSCLEPSALEDFL